MPRIARVARGVAPPLVCCYLAPRSVGPPSRPSGCYSNDLWGRVEAGGRRTAGGGWLVVRALHATALLHDPPGGSRGGFRAIRPGNAV
eukprot:scaffold4498_cov119-Isochrysis_galbana.AAC.21